MFDPVIPEHVHLAHHVYSLLEPGQEKLVAAMCISQAALDHYLSGTAGSAYTLGYIFPGNRPDTWKNWTLFRLPESLENDSRGRRSYVDPDRRHLYDYDSYSGLYTPNKDHPINFVDSGAVVTLDSTKSFNLFHPPQ